MESLLLVWLIVNTLLLFVGLAGVFVLWRDRKKSLHSNLLKAHIQQLEHLEDHKKRLERLERLRLQPDVTDWLILLTERINGLIDLLDKIRTLAAGTSNLLETVKRILELLKTLQSQQSLAGKRIDITRLLAETKELAKLR